MLEHQSPNESSALLLPPTSPSSHNLKSILLLVVVGFFWVSGGIYGSEELVSAAPPAIVMVWTAGAAVLFALPNALMTAELSSTFPVSGGQVAWVSMACGAGVGGQNGYWVWLTNLLDAAVYPQMAARYLSGALPLARGESELVEQVVCLGVIVCACAVNLFGLDCVAATQSVAFVASLVPCLLFAMIGLPRVDLAPLADTDGAIDFALLVSWTVWLYSGFSSLGTMAGEVANPQLTYPAVVAILLPLVTILNLLPFAVALSLDADRTHYQAGYFATLAGQLAGPWLHTLFAIGANVSLLGLYHSQMLAAERALVAWGESTLVPHGWTIGIRAPPPEQTDDSPASTSMSAPTPPLPKRRRGHLRRWLLDTPGGGSIVPRVNTLANAMCAAALTRLHYTFIVEVEMMLYSTSHILFLYSFTALRWQQPNATRPFRLPGGIAAVAAYSLPPLCVCGTVIAANLRRWEPTSAYATIVLVGGLSHAIARYLVGRPRAGDAPTVDVSHDVSSHGRTLYNRVT